MTKKSIDITPYLQSTENENSFGEIIEVASSPYKRTGMALLSDDGNNENNSFYDIRDMDVNIIVRENTHSPGSRYLTSNGLQRELDVMPQNYSDNQKFRLYLAPLTNYVFIKDYQGHLVSMGVYSGAPETRILYVKDGTSQTGSCWDFLRGEQRTCSNIMENADATGQGSEGIFDVYNEVLGVQNSRLYFDRYNNSATQEFEIRVLEELRIVNQPVYDLANVNPEERPSYILRGTVHNNGGENSQMTMQYTDGAKVSSSFQENNSYTTSVSANTGVSTPVVSASGSVSSSNTYGFTYTSNSEKNISYMFNHTVNVPAHTTVQVTAVVKNYNVSCDYSALVEGITTGRRFTIYGRWDGISCTEVDYTIDVIDQNGIRRKCLRVNRKISEPLDLSRDALCY